MQTLSAYFFETAELSDDSLLECRDAVLREVQHWLRSKKVADPSATTGAFRSRTAGFPDGHFTRETLQAAGGYLEQTTLTEASGMGQNIETKVSVVSVSRRVSVHVNVNVYNVATILAPAHIIPRCPKIVQRLLKLPTKWLLNGDPAPSGVANIAKANPAGRESPMNCFRQRVRRPLSLFHSTTASHSGRTLVSIWRPTWRVSRT